jgi:hypothetical protein
MKALGAVLVAAAILCAGAPEASAQSNDTGRALAASNTLKLSADTTECGSQTHTLVKEFIVPYAGTVRVRWQLNSDGSSGAQAIATIQSSINSCGSATTDTAFQAATCVLRVAKGDSVKIFVEGTFNGVTFTNSTACIRNVRIHYDVINALGKGRVIFN